MLKSENYSIDIPHFYCLEYTEENKKLLIDIDFRERPIYLSTTMINKWEDPYQTVTITKDEKIRIINTIKKYLVEKRGFLEVIIED